MSGSTTNKASVYAARARNTPTRSSPGAARITKKQQLIRLLETKAGADIATLGSRLGWQPHTTRAALSGLRKVGFDLIRIEGSGKKPARYRIASAPPEPSTHRRKGKAVTDAR